jgi:hypothetical protein
MWFALLRLATAFMLPCAAANEGVVQRLKTKMTARAQAEDESHGRMLGVTNEAEWIEAVSTHGYDGFADCQNHFDIQCCRCERGGEWYDSGLQKRGCKNGLYGAQNCIFVDQGSTVTAFAERNYMDGGVGASFSSWRTKDHGWCVSKDHHNKGIHPWKANGDVCFNGPNYATPEPTGSPTTVAPTTATPTASPTFPAGWPHYYTWGDGTGCPCTHDNTVYQNHAVLSGAGCHDILDFPECVNAYSQLYPGEALPTLSAHVSDDTHRRGCTYLPHEGEGGHNLLINYKMNPGSVANTNLALCKNHHEVVDTTLRDLYLPLFDPSSVWIAYYSDNCGPGHSGGFKDSTGVCPSRTGENGETWVGKKSIMVHVNATHETTDGSTRTKWTDSGCDYYGWTIYHCELTTDTATPTVAPSNSPTSSPTQGVQCLSQVNTNTVTAEFTTSGNKYAFNGQPWPETNRIGLRAGEYILDIDSNHPLSFQLGASEMSVLDGTPTSSGGGFSYYTGMIRIKVLADFGTKDYRCSIHGWMGGQNNLIYSEACDTAPPTASPSVSPSASPTESPTSEPTTAQPTESGDTRAPSHSPTTTSPTQNPTRANQFAVYNFSPDGQTCAEVGAHCSESVSRELCDD